MAFLPHIRPCELGTQDSDYTTYVDIFAGMGGWLFGPLRYWAFMRHPQLTAVDEVVQRVQTVDSGLRDCGGA